METTLHYIPASDLHATPWKNGGGSTKEVFSYPPQSDFETFSWRISIAAVEQAGPFSSFPGIDRHIVLIAGQSMVLHHLNAERSHRLLPFQPLAFAGEDAIECELPTGPTFDFNLMVRRSAGQGDVVCWHQPHQEKLRMGHYVFHSAQGNHSLTLDQQHMPLKAGDSLYVTVSSTSSTLHSIPQSTDSALVVAHIQLLNP